MILHKFCQIFVCTVFSLINHQALCYTYFFKNKQDQASAFKIAYIFMVFGAQNCLMVASYFDQITSVCEESNSFQDSELIFRGQTFCQSLITSYQSLVTSHQLLFTSYQLLVTSYQLLVTSHQSLVTSYQSLVISHWSLVTSHQ